MLEISDMLATWELHFVTPASPDKVSAFLEKLSELRDAFSEMRVDFFPEGDEIHVMVGDAEVLQRVLQLGEDLYKVTVQFEDPIYSGRVRGVLELGVAGDSDGSQTDFVWNSQPQ